MGSEPRNLACIVNPKRIGIRSASCGRYATLACVTFIPDLYAAAVNYVGVSKLLTFMQTIPPYWEPFRAQMYEMVGNPDDPQERERMKASSPFFHVERILTPMFVARLGERGKPVRVVRRDGELPVPAPAPLK